MAPVSELNVTSLIDLGFSLLIIFMISTPLIQNERIIPVDLPESSEAQSRNNDQRFVDITIITGGYEVDGEGVDQAQLEGLLRGYTLSEKPPVISIRADRHIAYQEVVTLFDLLKKYNLTKINLPTQPAR